MVVYALVVGGRIKTGAYGEWLERETATAILIFVRFTLSFFNEFVLTKEFKARNFSCLTINVDEVAAGTRVTPNRTITWRGVLRQRGRNLSLLRARVLGSTWNFLTNSLFRRVIPVETRLQVFTQHIFSLGAVALIILRVVFLLRNSYEDLPSRTIVKPCTPDKQGSDFDRYMTPIIRGVLMSLPGHRKIPRTTPLSTLMMDNPYTVNVSMAQESLHSGSTVEPLNLTWVHTKPDQGDLVDWYGLFFKGGAMGISSGMVDIGYEYRIEKRINNATAQRLLNGSYTGIHRWFMDSGPSFWLGHDSDLLIPYLSPPIQPEYGQYMSFKTQVAQRRFIVSSPLWDSITGSDPTYSTTTFYSSSTIRREPLRVNTTSADSNTTLHATGLIYWPSYLAASKNMIQSQTEGQAPLCEITEDYRTTSTFDILASIGGLLALMQGIHILLFGRPLFWGMFGSKLITPFGLVGRLATNGFKKRLQERYHPPQPSSQAGPWQSDTNDPRATANVDMTQFLLDFVVDMGPASAPVPNREDDDDSSDSDESEYMPVQYLKDVEEAGDVVEFEWRNANESSRYRPSRWSPVIEDTSIQAEHPIVGSSLIGVYTI
ncbi:unnamed protein product [Rhizoctonia solani]|uniref:Uncharacterized protein n=1 Tax=Rhizoctonia solani TaxID=456999 RepID=A0A8H3E005_9AGAM|nr:unnamed protein product [Rhizoctonia solani]